MMLRRVSSAALIAGSVLLVSCFISGAPLRVHLAQAMVLICAFLLPSMWVGGWNDLRRWPALPLVAGLVGGLIWDVGAAVTIAKSEVFHQPLIYPAAVIGVTILFATHASLLSSLSRRALRREGGVKPRTASDRAVRLR